ncbi:hypothetical protein D3C71_1488180 [compost metagenome]
MPFIIMPKATAWSTATACTSTATSTVARSSTSLPRVAINPNRRYAASPTPNRFARPARPNATTPTPTPGTRRNTAAMASTWTTSVATTNAMTTRAATNATKRAFRSPRTACGGYGAMRALHRSKATTRVWSRACRSNWKAIRAAT